MPDNEVPATPAPAITTVAAATPGAAVSVFGGVGIGLMVGALLGLSVSPTVGAFVGAVGAALAALLGLNDAHFSSAKALRIGSFGLAVIVGAAAGIYARANDLLSPGIEARLQRKQEYLRLGYTEREALDFLHRQTVVSPSPQGGPAASGTAPSKPAAVAAAGGDHRMTVLFSSPLDTSTCDGLSRGGYDATMSADDVVANFKLRGGSGWAELATSAQQHLAGAADRKALLFIARDAHCKAATPARLDAARCKALPADAPAGAIETALQQTPALKPVAARVQAEITPAGREAALRLLLGVFCAS